MYPRPPTTMTKSPPLSLERRSVGFEVDVSGVVGSGDVVGEFDMRDTDDSEAEDSECRNMMVIADYQVIV